MLLFGAYTSLCLGVQLLLSQPSWLRRACIHAPLCCVREALTRGARLWWGCWHKLRLRRLQGLQGGGRRKEQMPSEDSV